MNKAFAQNIGIDEASWGFTWYHIKGEMRRILTQLFEGTFTPESLDQGSRLQLYQDEDLNMKQDPPASRKLDIDRHASDAGSNH